MEKFIKSSDIELFIKEDIVEDGKVNLIVNHGFAEHLARYDYFVDRLNEAGISVFRYDLRGHGRTKSEKGYLESYWDFIKDLDTFVDYVRDKGHGENLYTFGHSMGGFITSLYGLEKGDKMKGQIFTGPALGKLPVANRFNVFLLKFLNKTWPRFPIKNNAAKDISRDKEVVEAYKKDPLVLKSASARLLNTFINEGINYLLENMTAYDKPVLICHGKDDKIVPAELSKNFYEQISSSDKELKLYDGLYHEILNEKPKDEIIDYIIDWLKTRNSFN